MSLDCFLKHFISYKKFKKYNSQKNHLETFEFFFLPDRIGTEHFSPVSAVD